MTIKDVIDGINGYPLYLVVLATAIMLYWQMRPSLQDPGEPPSVQSSIPLVGHAIGMMREKTTYLDMLSAKNPFPIFTIPILNGKVYIISSPDLVQSALRCRELSFNPFSITFTRRVLGHKTQHYEDMTQCPENDQEVCYINEIHKHYHAPLTPGPLLHPMNARMLRELSTLVNSIGPDYERKDLYHWIRDSFTVGTSKALFGSRNPIARDASLINALWDFEEGIQLLMIDFLPWLTAPKARKAILKTQHAFREYFHAGYDLDDDVSTFIKRLVATQRKYGFSTNDIGDFQVSMMTVATTNAIPTLFWFVIYVFSSPALVASLRAEIATVTTPSTSRSGPQTKTKTKTIDVSAFPHACPLLFSAYQETMRLSNKSVAIRGAEKDAVVSSPDGTVWRIPRHSVVFMHSSIHHVDASVWGADAHVFDARRFLKRDAGLGLAPGREGVEAREAEKAQKKAYFPFGGGRHYCPGRHFALVEMLGFVSVLVAGFEVVGVEGGGPGGPLSVPERRYRYFSEAIPKPVGEMGVFIRRREGFEDVEWVLDAGAGEEK